MADQWYYAKNGQQLGPVTRGTLQDLATSGQLAPADLVWTEGMPAWAPARHTPGLFPAVSAPPQGHPSAPFQISPPPEVQRPFVPRPDFEQGPVRDDEDDDYVPRRHSSGPNKGLMAVGAVVAVLVVIGIIVLIAVLAKGSDNPRTFSIAAGEERVYHIDFKQGDKAEIWVESENNTDIDIFVFSPQNQKIAEDIRFDKNCYVVFAAPSTGSYRVEVANISKGGRLPVGPNRCTMRYSPDPRKKN
ncbi:MAG: DUF4339 domain-containing protein [Gemmataceae bacterium]|nr:DUF4339 domain-containing protein [Gemmataceae bacterium]